MNTEHDPCRIPNFYRYSVGDRLRILRDRSLLPAEDYALLQSGKPALKVHGADRMVENVIGVFSLPLGVGLNFRINELPYVVPMVVEEPSIIAALSSAAKLVGKAGGFESVSTDPILIGQIQVVDTHNASKAKHALLQKKDEILNLANSLHPRMAARGGGARDIEVAIHPSTSMGDMVVVHVLVDTRDAMGANFVNSMCEELAPLIERISGGRVFLRILSNLTDRSTVTASVRIPTALLGDEGFSGEDVRDGIILANEFARIDPYRAATHNKGIMNGIDGVALATGNDWRSIEAAAHAYAARGTHYTALTRWECGQSGDLCGTLEIPLKVGIVGAPLQSNPTVGVNLRMLGVRSAKELAEVMGAVGLAQNFAALRALVTEGIQEGHMTLHARSVAMAAGATPEIFDVVVEQLISSGEIKVWKAEEIVHTLSSHPTSTHSSNLKDEVSRFGVGHGKVILLGEHAVVYGAHAIAAPIPLAIQAKVEESQEGIELVIRSWGIEEKWPHGSKGKNSLQESIQIICKELGVEGKNVRIFVFPNIPRAMGMGGSAAIAVAVIRALANFFEIRIKDEEVNRIAFACETVAHGTASGIDNTLATFGQFMMFQRGQSPLRQNLAVPTCLPLVMGITGVESLTAKTVAHVRAGWRQNPALYEHIFSEIDTLVMQGKDAIQTGDLKRLGVLMNLNHGLLNALQVSSPELEELIQIARDHGAWGAKLTGGGGGGSMLALCPENGNEVAAAMQRAGYQVLMTTVEDTKQQ